MNPDISTGKNLNEPIRETVINLDNVSFEFCDDNLIKDFLEKKLEIVGNKEKWLSENAERFAQNPEAVAEAVSKGLIADSKLETIWQFQVDRITKGSESLAKIKAELAGRIDEIKRDVAQRLARFLPDWTADPVKVAFALNEKADFCVDGDEITIDLWRLLSEDDPIEIVKQGLTHEVFHTWMQREEEWSDYNQDSVSDESLKRWIIFKTVDEGLAVLVSGQSLEAHHARSGRDFKKFIEESFKSFNNFLAETDRGRLDSIKDVEFQNMGHFYVVGNEIAKAILEHDEISKFKELLIKGRDRAEVFLNRYNEICSENVKLPRIKFE